MPTFSLSQERLAASIRAALQAACGDDSRPHIATVLFELAVDGLHVVATNGHWLVDARPVGKWRYKGDPIRMPIARREAEELAQALRPRNAAQKDWTVRLQFKPEEPARLSVKAPQIARVYLVGKDALPFPPWREVVPSDSKLNGAATSLRLDAIFLFRAVDAARTFLGDTNSARYMGFHGSRLDVRWASPWAPLRIDGGGKETGEITVTLMPARKD